MMTLVRRFVVLAALFFWQGGFTFYAAVAVPVGQEVLGRAVQPRVTRRVTNWLNLAGAIALAPLAWDVGTCRDPVRRRRLLRWGCWLLLVGTLVLLGWLHLTLDRQMDLPDYDHAAFRPVHRAYLWISTVQWAGGLVYLGATLSAWRGEDRRKEGEERGA